MTDKDKIKATEPQTETEAVELDLDQLDQVAGGDRGGKHKPPTNPDGK